MDINNPTKEFIEKIDIKKTKHRKQAEIDWYVYRKGYYDVSFFIHYFLRDLTTV